MCAWYHVVPSWAEYQNTVPNAKNSVVATAHGPTDRQPAQHPPGDPDVDGGEDREDELAVGGPAPDRDERQQQHRRQRRERDVATGHAVARFDRPDVVEAGVAGARVDRPDRVADRGLALEEGLGLPLEVVVDPDRMGRSAYTKQGVSTKPRPIAIEAAVADRREPGPAVPASLGGCGESEGWKGPCATLRSTSARSSRRPSPVDSPRIGRAEPGRGRTDADHLDAGGRRRDPGRARPRARRSAHHRIRLPRHRPRSRPRLVPRLGGEPRARRPVRRLRPGLLPRLHARLPLRAVRRSGSSGRRPAASAT